MSELIVLSINALLDTGDEVLVPTPDYPLWTAAGQPLGARPYTTCDEGAGWLPDLDDIRAKITEHTRAIVIINPNNPTGALYPDDLLKEILEIARQHDLIVFADEIYDKILYDGATHTSIASLADDVLCITMNGSIQELPRLRLSGRLDDHIGRQRGAADYLEGLNMLASMRLCANVPGQLGIQTALGGYQSINELVQPGGYCAPARSGLGDDHQHSGRERYKPRAALYLFPRLDPQMYPIEDDHVSSCSCWNASGCCWCRAPASTGRSTTTSASFLPNSDDLDRGLAAHRSLPGRLSLAPRPGRLTTTKGGHRRQAGPLHRTERTRSHSIV